MSNNIENMPFASELLSDRQKTEKRLWKAVVIEFIFIVLLVCALVGISIYHDYKWSMFDTVVVDSGDGNANYIEGNNNTGGVINGIDYSEETQENE